MSTATIRWTRRGDFTKGQYSRAPAAVTPDLIRGLPTFYGRKERRIPAQGRDDGESK